VADKYGLIARHLSQWRGLARKGKLDLPGNRVPMFVPLVVEPVTAPNPVAAKPDAGVVKIEIAGAVLHVASDCSPERAAALASALKRVL
jgi:transposase